MGMLCCVFGKRPGGSGGMLCVCVSRRGGGGSGGMLCVCVSRRGGEWGDVVCVC